MDLLLEVGVFITNMTTQNVYFGLLIEQCVLFNLLFFIQLFIEKLASYFVSIFFCLNRGS